MPRTRRDQLIAFGIPKTGGNIGVESLGDTWYVDPVNGSDGRSGRTVEKLLATIGRGIERAAAGDLILVAPGPIDEEIIVPVDKTNLVIQAMGGKGSTRVAPTGTDVTALTNLADDLTLINLSLEGDGTGSGMANYGSRLRAYDTKMFGGTVGFEAIVATAAQETAGTHGICLDILLERCEICDNTTGVTLNATDYGALTNARFVDCVLHDNSAADFAEIVVGGGAAATVYRGLEITRSRFNRLASGAEPTAYILLNGDNGNMGVASLNSFPSALAGGKNLVSTGLIWTSNFHTGGLSNGQPS